MAGECFTIEDNRVRAQPAQRFNDQRKAIGQVISGAAIEPHMSAALAGDDPEAIVLYFMDPELARRRSRRFGRQAWRDEARR